MKTSVSLVALLMIFFLQPCFVHGQDYKVAESHTILKDFLHKTFPVGDKYIDIIYASPHGMFSYNRDERHARVSVYDHSLNQLFETNIKEMEGKKYETGLVVNKHLYIFATDKNQKLFGYELNPKDGSAVQMPESLLDIPSSDYNVLSGYSPDSAYCFISFTNYGKKGFLRAVVLDNNMKVVHRLQGDLPSKLYDIAFTSLLLSNSGSAIGIAGLNNTPKKKENDRLKFTALEFSSEGNMTANPLEGLPSGYISQFHWASIKAGFSFVALLAPNDKNEFTTLVSGEYNTEQRKVINISQSPLNIPVPENTWLLAAYNLKDLSHYLILESRHVDYFYDSRTGRSRGSNYWAGNVYIVKTGPDGKAQWVKQIEKSQLEAADWIYTGIAYMLDEKESLHVFFHDRPESNSSDPKQNQNGIVLEGRSMNQTSLIAVKFTPDGNVTKQIISSNKNQDFRFSPTRSYSSQKNELIYCAMNWKVAGQSKLTLGTLSLH